MNLMCTSMISRIPFRARTIVRGCLRSSKSSQSCSATDLSCHPGTDVCLLRVATLSISSTASSVLVGRTRMMTCTSVTSSYESCFDNLLILYHILQQIAVYRCRWLSLSDGQGHKHDLLLVGSFTTHIHVFLRVRSGAYGHLYVYDLIQLN